jgi:hypothetical protein
LREGQTIYNQTEILHHVNLLYETLYVDNDSNLVDVNLDNIVTENNSLKLGIHLDKKFEDDIEESEVIRKYSTKLATNAYNDTLCRTSLSLVHSQM